MNLPLPSKLSCRQATVASKKLNPVSQTVPHALLMQTSNLPSSYPWSNVLCEFESLNSPSEQFPDSIFDAIK